MDVLYGAMEDGDHVVSYEYNGGVNQQWQFIQTDPDTTQVVPDGYYEIKSAVSGKNLEVYGASTQGGAKKLLSGMLQEATIKNGNWRIKVTEPYA